MDSITYNGRLWSSLRRFLPINATLSEIGHWEPALAAEDEARLAERSRSLVYRAKSAEPLWRLLPEAFALVREAAKRTIGLRHYDVQLLGGIAIFRGAVAEMETGEGKTLAATPCLYLYALAGKGAHLATVNDYLAARDAEWMRPVFRLLGMNVGVVQTHLSPPERQRAYAADITYGTAKEFGFDFLRDRLQLRQMAAREATRLVTERSGADAATLLQRSLHFALVDEADSILIDEARVPLVISATNNKADASEAATFRWAAWAAPRFSETIHYRYDQKKRELELNERGRELVRTLEKPAELAALQLPELYEYVERGIRVGREFQRDVQYIVRDGEVVIVDEFTGRLGEGRRWRHGIHQAVAAKEALETQAETGHAARITIQDLFLRYRYLAGMTGSAWPSRRELRHIYRLRVVPVPTHRPVKRQRYDTQIVANDQDKWEAIVEEVIQMHTAGRPVLIGTRSIQKSEELSERLTAAGLPHQVLNARHIASEAEIVASAGQAGRITVATNMAGRGTDIKLGEGVAELGGLHVILTELHESARIDRQLAGRCGRQGDPGSMRQYLAADDDILKEGFGESSASRFRAEAARGSAVRESVFRRAQRRTERRNFVLRKVLLHQERERQKLHRELGQDPYLDAPE